MQPYVADLRLHRVKGARGVVPPHLSVSPTLGILGNRRFAFRRNRGDMATWAPKTDFFVCMNAPEMAVEVPVHRVEGLEPNYLEGLKNRVGISNLQIQDTGDRYNLCDTKGAFVSFLNLASVRALSEFIGAPVNPARFRMDVWLDGLKPFEELEWVNGYPGTHEIQAGEVRFRIDDACERCQAIEANPNTGVWDTALLKALHGLMSKRGYKSPHRGTPIVMGVLGAPLNAGIIQCKQTIFPA